MVISRAISLQLLGLSGGKKKGYADFQQSDNICVLLFQIPSANLVSQNSLSPHRPKLKIKKKDFH